MVNEVMSRLDAFTLGWNRSGFKNELTSPELERAYVAGWHARTDAHTSDLAPDTVDKAFTYFDNAAKITGGLEHD